MAFLDNLGKKVTEAGQKTIQKTKELSEISKLNSIISDEEKRINNFYSQIGKLYISLHHDDCEEDFSGMISMIDESETKIKEYQKEILNIKGVQHCEKCGAEIQRDAAFCSSCGTTTPKIQLIDMDEFVKCGDCGELVKRGMRFCTSCGKPMEICSAGATLDIVIEENEERKCQNCGTMIPNDSAFCTECGTKI